MPPISRDGIVNPLSKLILINAEGLIAGRDLQEGGARAPRQIWAGARGRVARLDGTPYWVENL